MTYKGMTLFARPWRSF